ncbi:DNA-binding CsgD family transcriptional regulator [Paenibacillus sp. DS2015]
MISLIQKQNIILMHHREGRSQREIGRMTGVDRKTIRKYIVELNRYAVAY